MKTALEITDVRTTDRMEILEVILAATGKPLRVRRDQVDFSPGMVLLPWWLAQRVV